MPNYTEPGSSGHVKPYRQPTDAVRAFDSERRRKQSKREGKRGRERERERESRGREGEGKYDGGPRRPLGLCPPPREEIREIASGGREKGREGRQREGRHGHWTAKIDPVDVQLHYASHKKISAMNKSGVAPISNLWHPQGRFQPSGNHGSLPTAFPSFHFSSSPLSLSLSLISSHGGGRSPGGLDNPSVATISASASLPSLPPHPHPRPGPPPPPPPLSLSLSLLDFPSPYLKMDPANLPCVRPTKHVSFFCLHAHRLIFLFWDIMKEE